VNLSVAESVSDPIVFMQIRIRIEGFEKYADPDPDLDLELDLEPDISKNMCVFFYIKKEKTLYPDQNANPDPNTGTPKKADPIGIRNPGR